MKILKDSESLINCIPQKIKKQNYMTLYDTKSGANIPLQLLQKVDLLC